MRSNQILVLLSLVCLWFPACRENEDAYNEYSPKFVVEGWIENDDYPTVILTRNVPYFSELDSAELADVVLRFAKVTVSDGERSEILTARKDANYFPSYVYRGSDFKGRAGKTYTLKIEYGGAVLNAVTTIPQPVKLDSIWFVAKSDTSAQLQIRFRDPEDKNYYKIYTQTSANKRFVPTLLSNHDDKFFNGQQYTLQVNRGPENNLTTKNKPYFKTGEEVLVKFSSIPKDGFEFWNSFQNEVLNSSNPLIGSTGKIASNIQGPALGVWCGYGSYIYKVTARP